MKKLFFLALLFCISSLTLKSQDYKHEIGLNLFKYNSQVIRASNMLDSRVQLGIVEFNELHETDYNYYRTYVSPHLFYTFSINKNLKARGEIQYTYKNNNRDTYSSKLNPPWLDWTGSQTIKSNRIYFGSGVQYNLWVQNKLHPYLFGIGTLNAIFSRNLDYDPFGNLERHRIHKPEFLLGYNLGVGIQYQFSNCFSTNLEVSENSSFESHLISRLSINYHF